MHKQNYNIYNHH